MKKSFILLMLVCSSTILFSQSAEVEYMDKISSGNEKIQQESWDYMSAIARGKSARKVEKRRKEVEDAIREALKNVQSIKKLSNDTYLKNASIEYLEFHLDMMTGKAKKLVDMEEISSKSFDGLEAYILYQRELKELMNAKNQKIKEVQRRFASENNINLIEGESELSKKLKTGSQVMDYTENLYLVFMRCFMYEQQMLGEMFNEESDFNYQSLGLFLDELVEKSRNDLDTITDVNRDTSLRIHTKAALDFFQDEANTLIPALNEYKKLENEVKDQNKQMEQLSNKEKTKEKINDFNKLVNKLNTEGKKFNNMLETYNKKREMIVNNFNKSSARFIDNHIPK